MWTRRGVFFRQTAAFLGMGGAGRAWQSGFFEVKEEGESSNHLQPLGFWRVWAEDVLLPLFGSGDGCQDPRPTPPPYVVNHTETGDKSWIFSIPLCETGLFPLFWFVKKLSQN